MSEYSEKLKDPRWQKKRLEVFSRDNFTCVYCTDSKSTLHVHHLFYTGDPWEAPMDILKTLCEDCHKFFHYPYSGLERYLIQEEADRNKGDKDKFELFKLFIRSFTNQKS